MGAWYGTMFLVFVVGTLWAGLARIVWKGLKSDARTGAPDPVWLVLLSGRDDSRNSFSAPGEVGSGTRPDGHRRTAA